MKKFLKYFLLIALVLFVLLMVIGAISSSNNAEQAEIGGFESVSEYKLAKKENIKTKVEYDEFIKRQIEADKKAAKTGGFVNIDEYKKAKSLSISTKALYDKYIVQQEEKRKAEELRVAEEKRKAEEKRIAEEKRKAEEKRIAEEKRKAEEFMKPEYVKQLIKKYLGPCSGSGCKINIALLDEYLKKHEDYSKGKISALISGPSGSKYIEAYLRNGKQIEVYYYDGKLKKQRDTVKIDTSKIIEIYSTSLRNYGAEVFENWYRAPKQGIKNLKSKITSFVRSKAREHMIKINSSAENEWNSK